MIVHTWKKIIYNLTMLHWLLTSPDHGELSKIDLYDLIKGKTISSCNANFSTDRVGGTGSVPSRGTAPPLSTCEKCGRIKWKQARAGAPGVSDCVWKERECREPGADDVPAFDSSSNFPLPKPSWSVNFPSQQSEILRRISIIHFRSAYMNSSQRA